MAAPSAVFSLQALYSPGVVPLVASAESSSASSQPTIRGKRERHEEEATWAATSFSPSGDPLIQFPTRSEQCYIYWPMKKELLAFAARTKWSIRGGYHIVFLQTQHSLNFLACSCSLTSERESETVICLDELAIMVVAAVVGYTRKTVEIHRILEASNCITVGHRISSDLRAIVESRAKSRLEMCHPFSIYNNPFSLYGG